MVGMARIVRASARRPQVKAVGFSSARFPQAVDGHGDQHAGCPHDEERPPPAEGVAHGPADTDTDADAGQEQALLDREGPPPLLLRVVVGDETGC
jgi:hypothetical protein